ncbi:unnamed protein product [Schistocephalus solidus]|uniref:Succinate dehydrogenase assembly factor 3 n=1 Tax=Schistocephalus solidus TaxID=70667 RepID=A0A183TEA5_SCHSO|nr:unnamed protein product [Schistocephalus solidus]
MSSHQVMTHPERVRFLYKMILRLHRSLPTEMRLVGDKYVREEFRKHKTAEKQFVGPFMIEWSLIFIHGTSLVLIEVNRRVSGSSSEEEDAIVGTWPDVSDSASSPSSDTLAVI